MVLMSILSALLSMMFLTSILHGVYSSAVSIMVSIVLIIIGIVLIATVPTPLRRRVSNIEKRFINNINDRENHRTGREHNLVSDLQVAYMNVGQDCPFVGERLRNLDLRSQYGVNLVNIQRGSKHYPVPSGDMRIFPGDVLGVIGTEEQIQRMLPLVEANHEIEEQPINEVKFIHFAISKESPIVGVALEKTKLREDYGALLVAVQRGEDDFISPTPDLTFHTGDILWIVGNPKRLAPLKG